MVSPSIRSVKKKPSADLFRYGTLSTRRVDLVGDYAGQELFLVEGDSLLLRCFSDPRLDFDGQCCVYLWESYRIELNPAL